MIKIANKNLAATRSYDYLADGKYKTTKAWDTVTDRHKKQNKPFTHLEGILEGLIANPGLKPDMSSIQDGIIIKFAPAAQSHFNKPWFSPDVSTGEVPLIATFISKYITGTDRRARLDASYEVCSEVPLFCSDFNSKRSSNFTNLLITMASLHSITAMASFV
jgi:hypothetical protein